MYGKGCPRASPIAQPTMSGSIKRASHHDTLREMGDFLRVALLNHLCDHETRCQDEQTPRMKV